MKSSPEPIRFSQPLRDVRPGRCAAPSRDWEGEVRSAFERGRQEGERMLAEQLLQQRNETRQVFEGVIASLQKSIHQVTHDSEQQLVALALEIARKLIGDIPISTEMVEASVREAISQVEDATELHVRLHPVDLELLHKSDSSLLKAPTDGTTVRFHSSSEVSRGGCLVQTRFGVLDARRETRFDLLKNSVLA
ncbi:MAG: hypothetical protein IT580_13945 [Verrucomicrobiales bacterium]|nr:hypothetical protein [Verrucomicrobiales bacterium]